MAAINCPPSRFLLSVPPFTPLVQREANFNPPPHQKNSVGQKMVDRGEEENEISGGGGVQFGWVMLH